jgi:hypothetical protein
VFDMGPILSDHHLYLPFICAPMVSTQITPG